MEEKLSLSSRSRSGVSGCSKRTSVATVEATVDAVCVLAWDWRDTEDFERPWLAVLTLGCWALAGGNGLYNVSGVGVLWALLVDGDGAFFSSVCGGTAVASAGLAWLSW